MDFPETPSFAGASWTDPDAAIYVADGEEPSEAGRAIGISLLGVDPIGPVTFFPEGEAFKKAWKTWLSDRFENDLGPHFVGVYLAAGEMRNRRIVRLDTQLGGILTPEEIKRSLAAAVALFEGTTEVRRAPQWVKFLHSLDAGETPGHAVSLFALRSALFHLPLLAALVSYVYFEWKSAAGALSIYPVQELTVSFFSSRFPESIAAVKRVFESEAGDAFPFSSV